MGMYHMNFGDYVTVICNRGLVLIIMTYECSEEFRYFGKRRVYISVYK